MDTLAPQTNSSALAALWLAVLDQALVDAFILPRSRTYDWRKRRGVRLWFLTRRFEYVCDQCGLDPVWVRELIEKYERARVRLKPWASLKSDSRLIQRNEALT